MRIGEFGGDAAALGADEEALLDEEGFVHLLQGAGILGDGCSEGSHAHRTALEQGDERPEDLVVNGIQPPLVDFEFVQGEPGDFHVDPAVAEHLREIPHPLEQGIGDPGRAAAAEGDFLRRIPVDFDTQDGRAADDDLPKVVRIIVFQGAIDAETVAEGSRQQAAPRRRPHQGEGIQRDPDAPGPRSLVDHDVDDIVLHRGVQVFLHFRRKPVDFVDEQHVPFFQGGEKARQVARLVQHGTARHLHVHAHLICDDMRQGGLSESRRTVEQRVVQGFAAHLRGLDIDLQVGNDFLLSGEIIQLLRADNSVQFTIFAVNCAAGIEFAHRQGPVFSVTNIV